jgi:hypothetical protein
MPIIQEIITMDDDTALLGLIAWLEDERLQRLIPLVWERLPACDRAVLDELVLEVNETIGDENEGGSVVTDTGGLSPGSAGDIAERQVYTVRLGGTKKAESDASCMSIIAHEFAHIVLRHNQLSAVVDELQQLGCYSKSDLEQLNRFCEEGATLLAWAWGFKDEIRAFYKEFPEAEKPRWFVDVKVGGELAPEQKAAWTEKLLKEEG